MISLQRIERLDKAWYFGRPTFYREIADAWPAIRDALRARAELPLPEDAKAIRKYLCDSLPTDAIPDVLGLVDSLSRRAAELEAENAKLAKQLEERSWQRFATTTYKHVKTGGVYQELCRGRMESGSIDAVVIYQHVNNKQIWVRPASEFDDGRFAALGAEHE